MQAARSLHDLTDVEYLHILHIAASYILIVSTLNTRCILSHTCRAIQSVTELGIYPRYLDVNGKPPGEARNNVGAGLSDRRRNWLRFMTYGANTCQEIYRYMYMDTNNYRFSI